MYPINTFSLLHKEQVMKKLTDFKTLVPFLDALPIPPRKQPHQEHEHEIHPLRISMRPAQIRLHAELPPTSLWTYEGSFPGPVIDVRRGQNVVVEWKNDLQDAPLPFATALADDPPEGENSAQNVPGSNGASAEDGVEDIKPWTVVHLHGAKVHPDSDGWTDNMLMSGQSKLATYPNDQAGCMLWYHDHGMNITRYNVFSGLAGAWIIRDEEDDALPRELREREIPLVICDRNLETDADGNLTGQLLHKIEQSTREFFGPYTLVNGKIWPYLDVQARPYRFRVLNNSNSRFYSLVLLVDEEEDSLQQGTPTNDAMMQIGTEMGLLGAPVTFAADEGLTLAPAERADILIDFSRFRGKRVRLVNIAGAPFHSPDFIIDPPGAADLEKRVPFPNVMQFRVEEEHTHDSFETLELPVPLSPSFVRLSHDMPHSAHRWVALVEDGDAHMLTLRELLPVHDDYAGPVIEVQDGDNGLKRFRVAAHDFPDTVNFFVAEGATEVWKFINLSEDVHPVHVHLVRFQAISRQAVENADAVDISSDSTASDAPLVINPEPLPITPSEQGWKDTIRVNPGEVVSIMATFEGFFGRFMYHCHMVEHEDSDMMRPFVVLPALVAKHMTEMNGSAHSHGM